MNRRVFVYGSLMRGMANHRLLDSPGVEFVGEAKTVPAFVMLDLGDFPGVIPCQSNFSTDGIDATPTAIHGEVYVVSRNVFRNLDMLEGYPRLYDRREIKLEDETHATIYTFNLTVDRLAFLTAVVPDGDWRSYYTGKEKGYQWNQG